MLACNTEDPAFPHPAPRTQLSLRILLRTHLGHACSRRHISCDWLCSEAHDAVPW